MSLTDIPNPTPLIEPAVAEKVYDKQFCTKLEITSHPSQPWTAKIVGMPYNGTELAQAQPLMVELRDLKALAIKDQELAQAMGAVLAVIGKYLVKCKLKNKRIVTDANIEEILE